jgi:hypothetical protein
MNFSPFTPDNIKQLLEKQRAYAQLEKLGNVWTSPDIAIEKPVIVQPGEFKQGANLILNKKDLPKIDINRGAMNALNWSVRSFLAQSGIEIRFHGGSLTDGMLKDINEGKSIPVPVSIENFGQRAVELNGNAMRFFWVKDRLHGKELVDVIKSGEFAVEGVEGKDWYLGGSEQDEKLTTTGKDSDKGLCVVVRLKQKKYYVPYSAEPIKRDESVKIREQLSTILAEIPEGQRFNFEIGETPRMKLSSNIVGVINMGAEAGQRHINSPFIDAGSDWPIRTETNGLDYIDVFVYRK